MGIRVQILDKAVRVSFRVNTFRKGILGDRHLLVNSWQIRFFRQDVKQTFSIIIIIIIIKSCWCMASFLIGPPDSIQCPHRADVCKFMLVGLHWCAHISTGERRLCVRPCFTDNVKYILLVLQGWFVRWEVSGRRTTVLKGAVSRICSKMHTVTFSPGALLELKIWIQSFPSPWLVDIPRWKSQNYPNIYS